MGNLPFPASSGVAVLNLGIAPPASESAKTPARETSRDIALIDFLRETAVTGSLSADAILGALADAARVLSGADGTAIASRNNGVIVCHARSGTLAPGLGTPLNSDSGISGECLRKASIQICQDTSKDARVDSEICRALGIRSIAVVPLCGRVGLFGILEAFSARSHAFQTEQLDSLRSLAEIAEVAYERERSAASRASGNPEPRVARFPASAGAYGDRDRAPSSRKSYGIWACVLLAALLAIAWVARISWRETGLEIAASTSTAQKPIPSTVPMKPSLVAIPDASVLAYPPARTRTRTARNASIVRGASETGTLLTPLKNPSSGGVSSRAGKLAGADGLQNAPPMETTVSNIEVPNFASDTAPLPQFGGVVSHGAVPATPVQRVRPIYPLQARSDGIAGDVVVDATIARNGFVRKVTVISGPRSLTDAAVTAVRQWRFSPALLNGTPVEAQQRITVAFKLP